MQVTYNCALIIYGFFFRLEARARRLHSQASKVSGSKLTKLMDGSYHLAVYRGQTLSLQSVMQEVDELKTELTAATAELSLKQDEISSMKVSYFVFFLFVFFL